MIPRRHLSASVLGSLTLAIGSAVLALRSLAAAAALEPLPAREPVTPDSTSNPPAPVSAGGKPEMSALELDPFRLDRRRPAERFRMPGEAIARLDSAGRPAPEAVSLVGTAVIDGGGFAMCRRGAEPPKLVKVGERIGDLTLRSVQRGRALFKGQDGASVELRVGPIGTMPADSGS